jgi:tRNA threonylcarbamoyladenosine biosynthesis protein TsaE
MIAIELNSIADLPLAARKILASAGNIRKFAFYGPMGAGKTTMIKALCAELGATGVVNSPTFALVNEYITPQGEPIYHLDLYRINSVEELFDLGYEEYFHGNHYVFIEWAEKAESLLPEPLAKVTIEPDEAGKRTLRMTL